MLCLLVFVPGRPLSEHQIAIWTLEGPFAGVAQSMALQGRFRPKFLSALVAQYFSSQVRRLQVHPYQNNGVEALLAQVALVAARVLVLQHVIAQACGRRVLVAAQTALQFGLDWLLAAVHSPRVHGQRPFSLQADATLGTHRPGRIQMHRVPMSVEAGARFAGVEAASNFARVRLSGRVRFHVRLQQLAREVGGAALGAQVVALGRVLRRNMRAQQRARVEDAVALEARHFWRRVARQVAVEARLRAEHPTASRLRTLQLGTLAQVRAQNVPGQVAPLIAPLAEVALDVWVQVHVANVFVHGSAPFRGVIAAQVAAEHARRCLHNPLSRPLRTRRLIRSSGKIGKHTNFRFNILLIVSC